MAQMQVGSNLLGQMLASRDLANCGLTAELVGIRSVKISRSGRFMGVWRQTVGSYDWYPAGYNQPQHRAPTSVDAVHHLVRTLGSSR